MTYAAGNSALAVDANTIINDINFILGIPSGTGSSVGGWNQTGLILPNVASGYSLTATDWANIHSRLTTIINQTGTTVSGFPSVSAFTAGKPSAFISALDGLTTTLKNNRFNLAAGTLESSVLSTKTKTTAWGGTPNYIIHDIIFSFASANVLHAFFNAGGKFTLVASRTGGSATTQNAAWTSLLTTMGTVTLDRAARDLAVTAGAGLANTNTWYSSGAYSTNNINVYVQILSGYRFRIRVEYVDAHSNTFSDSVDGTFVTTMTCVKPTSLYLSNPVIAYPTIDTDNSLNI